MPTTKVFEENNFYTGNNDVSGGGTVTVEQDAYLIASGDNALEVLDGPWKIKVDGYLESNLNGMALYDVTSIIPDSTLTVGTEGIILGGAGYSGVSTALALNVVNSGLIQGGAKGIHYHDIGHSSSKTISITNNADGEIRGDYGIYLGDSNHDLILKNAGIIDEVWWGRGSTITNSGTIEELNEYSSVEAYNNTLTNTGTINKGFGGGHGNDVVTNSGKIGGGVSVNNGNNTITNSGTIGTFVGANEGNDTLANSGKIGTYVHLSAGTNKVTNSGSIGAELTLGSGNDTVSNTGSIAGKIDFFDGMNGLTNGGSIDGNVTFGTGAFKIANTGTIDGFVFLTAGTGTVTNSGTISSLFELDGGALTLTNSGVMNDFFLGNAVAKITNTGKISAIDGGGSGADLTLTNSGSISAYVNSFGGALKLTNSGTITGAITAKEENDVLGNTKLIGDNVTLGDGKNTITNGGTIGGFVTTGVGDDTFTNTGHITFHVDLGDGTNKVTNSGTIAGSLTTGNGNDVVTSTGEISAGIGLGGGDDKFTGGKWNDGLLDGAGNDVYSFGGGNDFFSWGASGNDVIDGGAGNDAFDAYLVGGAVWINLDTKAVHVTTHDLAASSVVALASTGTVKGFERVDGSINSDIIAGSAANETFFGNDGADALYGGGGADRLHGGAGVDGFIYMSTKDSGNTKATRDTILDFTGAGGSGGDVIDLSGIDADTKTAGDTFHLIGSDTKFSGTTPGELRWVHELGTTAMTIIQGDVNGDGKADFSIAVVGTVDFVAGDFSL